MIRVLVVDDQRLVREGLTALLELVDDLHLVALAADGHEALALAEIARALAAAHAGQALLDPQVQAQLLTSLSTAVREDH